MSPSPDELVAAARTRISRVEPNELRTIVDGGGLIVDIRPAVQRAEEGELPGALVVERNVLEWRLDPSGDHRLPEVTDYDTTVVVVCSQGYASSLAADNLRVLGYRHAADLIGGYQAWLTWQAHEARGASTTP